MKKQFTYQIFAFILLGSIILQTSSCIPDRDRDKFLGSYNVSETCTSVSDNYTLFISELETSNEAVVIQNLWNWGDYVSADCSGSDIVIPEQNINGIIYKGSGSLSGITLTIELTVSDGVNPEEMCILTCVRK